MEGIIKGEYLIAEQHNLRVFVNVYGRNYSNHHSGSNTLYFRKYNYYQLLTGTIIRHLVMADLLISSTRQIGRVNYNFSRFNMPAMFIIIQRHKTNGIKGYPVRLML